MVYKKFRFVCATRIILLSLTIVTLIFLSLNTNLYASMIIVTALVVYQVYALVRYVDTTNRELSRFFDAMSHSDFSQSFINRKMGKSFEGLNTAFSGVIKKFQEARAEKEAHFRYLQTVVQHVGIGLISFLPDGEVGLLNSATKKLFGISHLKNIKDFSRLDDSLPNTLLRLQPGEKSLLKLNINNDPLQLAVYATRFQIQENRYTLVSMQNIGQELEENELESWQKLIRVLTHEIMNSVTPISSLASTVNKMLSEEGFEYYKKYGELEAVEDIRDAVETIERRSDGLLHFVDAYRTLTRLPTPNFQIFEVSNLFKQIQLLMQPRVDEKKISFKTELDPESVELTADPEMMEQALINLLTNSIQSVEDKSDAKIELTAQLDDYSRVIIEVTDNGPGIPEEVKEKIFIPFFTTKKEGSGIGLSLTRQIMRLHGGTITVNSIPDKGTVFRLKF
jgi:signal transduction histidine kinase